MAAHTSTQPSNLPADITKFHRSRGRDEHADAGDRSRPVLRVIKGMDGVGKSVPAVHAPHYMAWRYPDAQLYLNLRANDQVRPPLSPADALRNLLVMVGVPARRIPGSLRERADLWRAELAWHSR